MGFWCRFKQQFHYKKEMHLNKQQSSMVVKESELKCVSGQDHPFLLCRNGAEEQRDYLRNAEWTLTEKAKYFAFIDINCKKMEGRPHGKLWALYEEMGKFIKSRNFRQCKSFHQKMVDAHNTIPEVMSYLGSSHPGIEELAQKEKEQLLKIEMQYNRRISGDAEKTQAKTAVDVVSEKQIPASEGMIRNQEEEWKECHQLFVEWTNRLRNLMWQPPTTFV